MNEWKRRLVNGSVVDITSRKLSYVLDGNVGNTKESSIATTNATDFFWFRQMDQFIKLKENLLDFELQF